MFLKREGSGIAYQLFKRAADLRPHIPEIWMNMGKCWHDRQRPVDAEECFRKALKIRANFPNALEGMAMISINKGEFPLAIEYANRALAEDPEIPESRANRGMAYLALKRWREGWRDYNVNVGREKNRKEFIYGDEGRWDGTKGLDIICYGEQGIGDELSFASCLPDLIRDSKSVTIDCDGRLEKLFQRSFPTAEVHGTRYKEIPAKWREGRKFGARVALGQLPEFYRLKDADFPGTPYLVPNPEMALQWRSLLASLGDRPKIGLAWTGGLAHTGRARRSVTLDTLAPLFKFDATWVSLQYKETEGIAEAEAKYGVKIHDWDWGVRVYDYDQTVALISELDLVITVCTTVVHAAGGLGVPCWCLVPSAPMWRYLDKGEWFPWAKSVTLFRQKGREWPIHTLLGQLKDKFGARPRDKFGEGDAATQAAA